jgi:hypothetical protein
VNAATGVAVGTVATLGAVASVAALATALALVLGPPMSGRRLLAGLCCTASARPAVVGFLDGISEWATMVAGIRCSRARTPSRFPRRRPARRGRTAAGPTHGAGRGSAAMSRRPFQRPRGAPLVASARSAILRARQMKLWCGAPLREPPLRRLMASFR